MAGFVFGWRDAILLLVVVAAIYLVFMLLRLTRVRRLPHDLSAHAAPDIAQADAGSQLRQHNSTDGDEVGKLLENTRETPLGYARAVEDFASAPLAALAEAVPLRSGGFGEHLAEHLARSDVEMEVQRMRAEMERMRVEMEELRVARRVSPQYAEAMELSQRGLSAQDVADRLGISLAEAELVHALSRGDKNFDEGGEDGEDRYVASDEFDAFDGRRSSGRR